MNFFLADNENLSKLYLQIAVYDPTCMCDSSWLVLARGKDCYNSVYYEQGYRFMAVRLGVKEVAKEKGMSMGKLQCDADKAYNTIKRMFKDPYYVTTTETLGKLARALGVQPGELLEEVSDDSYKKLPSE